MASWRAVDDSKALHEGRLELIAAKMEEELRRTLVQSESHLSLIARTP